MCTLTHIPLKYTSYGALYEWKHLTDLKKKKVGLEGAVCFAHV